MKFKFVMEESKSQVDHIQDLPVFDLEKLYRQIISSSNTLAEDDEDVPTLIRAASEAAIALEVYQRSMENGLLHICNCETIIYKFVERRGE